MFYVKWRGKRLESTRSAREELVKHGFDVLDVCYVLENGFPCSNSRRAEGTIEKCIVKHRKLLRVVVKEVDYTYPDGELEYVLRIVHVGLENITQDKFKK